MVIINAKPAIELLVGGSPGRWMQIALGQEMANQNIILDTARLADSLLHPADFLQMEKPLILANIKIAKRLWQRFACLPRG